MKNPYSTPSSEVVNEKKLGASIFKILILFAIGIGVEEYVNWGDCPRHNSIFNVFNLLSIQST